MRYALSCRDLEKKTHSVYSFLIQNEHRYCIFTPPEMPLTAKQSLCSNLKFYQIIYVNLNFHIYFVFFSNDRRAVLTKCYRLNPFIRDLILWIYESRELCVMSKGKLMAIIIYIFPANLAMAVFHKKINLIHPFPTRKVKSTLVK